MLAKTFFALGIFLLFLMGFSAVVLDENAFVYSMFGINMNSGEKSQIEMAIFIAGASMIKFGHAAYIDLLWEAIVHYVVAFAMLAISLYTLTSVLWSV